MSTLVFKKILKRRIHNHEESKHRITVLMYKLPREYIACFSVCYMWPWFVHASKYPECKHKCVTILRIVVGVEREKIPVYCMCRPDQKIDASHIFFDCELIKNVRTVQWEIVMQNVPTGLAYSLNNMSSFEKTVVLIKGFGVKYIPEFTHCYMQVLDFMFNMYKTFCDVQKTIGMIVS